MNQKKINKLIFLAILLAIIVGIIFFLIVGNEKSTNERIFSTDDVKKNVELKTFENSVVFWTDDDIKKINLDSGNIQDASFLEKEDFSEFVGLPNFQDDKSGIQQNQVIVSKDKSLAIVTTVKYDQNADTSAFDGMQPVIGSDEFVCDIVKKKCEKSELFSQSYVGIDSKLQEKYGAIWFEKWNSEKNLLYGHLSVEGVGNASPVFVCDTGKKECKKTDGYDFLEDGEIHTKIPEGSFSPSLEKFVMVNQNDKFDEETGKKWEFLLYSSDDLSKPLKSIDISAIIDHDEAVLYDSVRSIAWSADEKKIAIGTTRRIFLLDIETESLTLAYIAPTNEDGEFYWDFNALFLSPDASTIVFVDEGETIDNSDENSDEADITQINVLKKIDLKNSNKVSELYSAPGLSLNL